MDLTISKEEFDRFNSCAEKHKEITLADDKHMIRPFKDWFECVKEGRELHHAVHFYGKSRYANGKDLLFVMRRIDTPDTPFIILEFSLGGKLLLAKKLHNADAKEQDELAFIERFRTEKLLPYVKQYCGRHYMEILEEFCEKFAAYVTGNWRENHLNIYVYLDETPVGVACYGLGKVNWSGKTDAEYPFHKCLNELVREVPNGTQEIHAQFNCGRLCNVNLRTT